MAEPHTEEGGDMTLEEAQAQLAQAEEAVKAAMEMLAIAVRDRTGALYALVEEQAKCLKKKEEVYSGKQQQ